MRRTCSWLAAIHGGIVNGCAAIVAVLILLTVFLVTADVAGRYFFSAPIGWVFELTEHILVCVPFLGMAWLVRHGGHVKIEIVVQMLPDQWRRRSEALAELLCALACLVAAIYALQTTLDHFSRGIVTYGIYPVPKFLLIAVVTFGLAMTAVEFVLRATETLRGEGEDA